MRNPATPLRSARRNMSSTLNKTSALCYKSPKITRPGSVSPVEVVTFLQESENEKLTEDWSKSLLYQKISNLDGIELAMTEQEMKVLSRKPPRDPEEIVKAMNKGLNLLRILLMELLGTKEDMQRFEERFRGNTRYHVRALMERCLNLMKVRNTTADILQKVHKREMILKNLRVTKNKIKDKVLKVFEMNKEIRADIENWASDDSVPFSSFTFKGKNYLAKISEDLIVLQGYLDRISAKGMNK
jgi:hypothetical protein